MEAERLRKGALQEAAFFRAKVATLESNSPIDLSRIEKERINELERQISTLHTDHQNAQRDLEKLNGESTASRDMHTFAIEREADTLKRAEEAEEAHRLAIAELEELQNKVGQSEQAVREHAERLITLSSVSQQREAERDHLQSQLDDAVSARDEHVGLIEQAQAAISAAGQRTAEMEGLYQKSNGRVHQLEEELAETRAELEVRTRDAELAQERLSEIENAYSKSREEADSLRTVTTGRLGDLLDSHKGLRADEGRLTRGHQEQIRALEEEGKSLRRMLKEAGQRVDAAESGVSHHRTKARELEVSHQGLRGEMRMHRTKLLNAQAELGKYRDLHQVKDGELREREGVVTELETRCTMLRNLRELIRRDLADM
jgi:chromosome segregation ATPase